MHETGCSGLVHWDDPEGWDGEGGSGWGTHVHPWLIHVNVWQKPLQDCKVISLQLKLSKVHSFLRCRFFTLAISCLTTSNLPWFMDLTFQIPMQYCSLQHQILLSSPERPTTQWCFHFGPVTSFFLELLAVVLHSSPVTYWTLSSPESSSFGVTSFWLFIQFMGFSQQLYWDGLPFPPPVDHILSELSTNTSPSFLGGPA